MNKKDKVLRELVPISNDDFFVVLNHQNAKFDFPLHYHPEIEINLVMNSSGKRIVGDSISDYCNQDLVIIGPNTPHCWIGRPEYENAHVITIQFHMNFISPQSLNKKLAMPIRDLLDKSSRGILFSDDTINQLKPKIMGLSENQDFDSFLTFLSILYDLSIARNTKTLASISYIEDYKISKSRRIQKVSDYIHQNLHRKILIQDVASLINMSESAFSHFFKKSTNSSFSDYVIDLRLGHAARELIETEKSISEICFDSGFSNISNFNRSFKRKLGFTPSAFRAQQKLITKH